MFKFTKTVQIFKVIVSYEDSALFLPGTIVDKNNIASFCKNKKIKCSSLIDQEVTLNSVKNVVSTHPFTMLFLSGHGFLNAETTADGFRDHAFVLPQILNNPNASLVNPNFKSFSPDSYIKATDFVQYLENNPSSFIMCINDFCNSGSFVNLEYIYNPRQKRFIENESLKPELKKLNTLIISISGSTDFTNAYEDSRTGGHLTSGFLELLNSKDQIYFDDLKEFINQNRQMTLYCSQDITDDLFLIDIANRIVNPDLTHHIPRSLRQERAIKLVT